MRAHRFVEFLPGQRFDDFNIIFYVRMLVMSKSYKKKMQGNVWKLYVISILSWFMIVMPIIVLFFQENGLSMTEVMVLQTIFAVAIVVCEVPSGYFADTFGRKLSIILGTVIVACGFWLYTVSSGFWPFVVVELLLAVGASFVSGADSAMLYDSLLALGRKGEYTKSQGRMSAFGNFSEGIAGILGGLLATISLRTPFFVEAVTLSAAVPFALTLVEPKQHEYEIPEGNLKNILRITKHALHDNKEVKWLILYGAFLGASTLTICWFVQPYWQLVGVPVFLFGVLWAVLQFVVGGASMFVHKIEKMFSRGVLFFLSISMVAVAYAGLGTFKSLWALAFLPLFYVVRGVNVTLIKAYINELVPSRMRATVLSVRQLMGRLTFSFIGPFAGWVADIYTIQEAMLVAGATFFILGLIAIAGLRWWRVV